MSHQLTFADSEFSTKRRQTRKEIFLSRMEQILPWQNMVEVIEPFYPKAGNGRRPYPLEGLQRIGPSAIARLGIKRLDDSGHILPWQNLLHAGEENLFSGLTALSAEFTIGEGELMAHDVPLGCAPDEYDDLISGTCSHLP